MFQAFDAARLDQFQRSLFGAADRIVEARKSLAIISTAKLYEVQKICS